MHQDTLWRSQKLFSNAELLVVHNYQYLMNNFIPLSRDSIIRFSRDSGLLGGGEGLGASATTEKRR